MNIAYSVQRKMIQKSHRVDQTHAHTAVAFHKNKLVAMNINKHRSEKTKQRLL